jgi:hypothetical protein
MENGFVGEPAKRVPVAREVDVAVAGAGCAGVFAALAAARNGARTLLIDRFGTLGGNVGPGMIYGCVSPFSEASLQLYGGSVGLAREVETRVEVLRAGRAPTRPLYASLFSRVMAEMMDESGVELMLSAYAADPIVDAGKVGGLFVETKSGRVAVRARTVIDATAEADLAKRAGAPMIRHVPPDPAFSPVILARYRQEPYSNWNEVGLVFLVAGIDWARYEEFIKDSQAVTPEGLPHIEPNGIVDSLQAGVVPCLKYPSKLATALQSAWERGSYRLACEFRPGAGVFWQSNMNCPERGFVRLADGLGEGTTIVYGDIDVDDWEQVSRAEHELRKHAHATVAFMQRAAPGFENAYVVATAPFAGARGGPCIEGEHVVTPQDILAGARHPDVVLRSIWEARRIADHKSATPATREGYDLPYRMMLPKGLDNLLVVGRGSSYVRRGHDPATRARVTQFHLGQVAGMAAALAGRAGTSVRALDMKTLQRDLLRQGFFLGNEARLRELGLIEATRKE